jgi:hypothetical protein
MKNLMMEVFFKFYMGADRYKHWIVVLFFGITLVWGVYVYMYIYHLTFIQSLSYTFGLFALDTKAPNEITDAFGKEFTEAMVRDAGEWVQIYYVSILAKITLLLTLFLVFIRTLLSKMYRKLICMRGGHTIVIGLGRNGRFFINSILEDKAFPSHRLIAFETDKETPYLANYKNKKVSTVTEDIDKMMEKLNLKECENIFISTGSDEKNIYYALQFLEKLGEDNKLKKLLVHIEDRTLRNLYSDEGVLNSYAIDMKVFSFYKESARMLFQEHTLDGDDRDIIESQKNFTINLVGNDDLTISMVVEACKLAHFPNENRLTINCIAKDTLKLKNKIEFAFPEIEKIESVKINYINLNHKTIEFYTHDVWNSDNLKHVFYCYDDVALNISIETKVTNVTYLRERERAGKINFYIATMNHLKIAKEIEGSKRENLFVFASSNRVCSYKNLLNNEIDTIARWSNHEYYKINIGGYKDADTLWKDTLINDKKSTIGQVIHMHTKLKFLGLEVQDEKNIKNQKELLEVNNRVIFKALEIKNVNDFKFSQDIHKKLNLLAKSEHNRWMALLMLMDYRYTNKSKKDKIQKEHPLLKPLSEFSDKELEAYSKYDINSILKISEYMAKLGKVLRLSLSFSKKDG